MKLLFIGDIVGQAALRFTLSTLPYLKNTYGYDAVIVNAENVAGGLGITPQLAMELLDGGVHAITLGNHSWSKWEISSKIALESRLVRPANGHPEWPGRGFTLIPVAGKKLAVVNLMGQIFMDASMSPFVEADRIVALLQHQKINHILLDFHAEASSEKLAMAYYLDGRVSVVCGTHTHVQTADEGIFKNGTGYITDVGMTGPQDSVIGMKVQSSLRRLAKKLPARYELAEGLQAINGLWVELDQDSGRCLRLQRIQFKEKESSPDGNSKGGK